MEMAIAMMKPIMPIVFMMEVTVVEGVPTLTNAQIACVKMEEQQELKHHVSALSLLLDDLASNANSEAELHDSREEFSFESFK